MDDDLQQVEIKERAEHGIGRREQRGEYKNQRRRQEDFPKEGDGRALANYSSAWQCLQAADPEQGSVEPMTQRVEPAGE